MANGADGRAAAAATATAEAALRLRDCQRDAVERPSPSWIDSKRGTTKVEIEAEIHLPSPEFFTLSRLNSAFTRCSTWGMPLVDLCVFSRFFCHRPSRGAR